MMGLVRKLASLKLTLIGMVALAVLSLVGARTDAVDLVWTIVPLVLLSMNLAAAILTNRSFRTQTGLLVFHVGLLLVFALIGLTVATRFNGRVEMLQGEAFDPSMLEVDYRGPLHGGDLSAIRFVQRDFEVDYLPGIVRQETRGVIDIVDDAGRQRRHMIGDKQGVEFGGFRFVATANKGFALVLGWEDASGARQFGAVHLPSYPKHDWKQVNDWTTPAGQPVRLELELDEPPIVTDAAWTLRRPTGGYRVHVQAAGSEIGVVSPGESIELPGGRLIVADLRLWMGYSVDYYPFLPWMFVAAMLAIGGLAIHFGTRYLPQAERKTEAVMKEAPDGHVIGA